MQRQAVYWLCLICIYISLSTASARSKRDLQTIRTIKDLIIDKVFSNATPESTVVAEENPGVKLFKIPGHDNILVKAVPVVDPGAVVEVIPQSPPLHPTVALIQSYLGTTTMNETLKALDGVHILLQSGILSRPALDKMFESQSSTSEVRVSDAIYSSDLHLPGPYPAPQPFTVVEKTIFGPLHSSYGVPIDAPALFDKNPVEIKELPRPISVPHTTYGVPLPGPVVFSERKPVAVDVLPGPATYQSYPSPLPFPGFGPLPVQELRPLPVQEIRRPIIPVQDDRFLPVPEFRPFLVQELRPPEQELRPLLVPDIRPLVVPNIRLPVTDVRLVQDQKIISKPLKSIYSYTQDGVVFASEGGKLRKVPFHPITAVRPIIVERIKQISEKMASLPKPVKVEIKPPVVPVPLEYFQVPKIVAEPFQVVETVNKESGLYQQVKKGIADKVSTLADPFLSRLIKKSDGNGGYYYERINEDGSVTKFSAEEIEQALPLSDTNSVIPGGAPVVIIPEQPPKLSRLVKKPDGHGGYYYEQTNDDGTITIFKPEQIETSVPLASRIKPESGEGAKPATAIQPNLVTSDKGSRGSSKYLYRQINADGTISIYTGFREQVDVKMPDQAEIDFTVPSRSAGAPASTSISVTDVKPIVAGNVPIFDITKGIVDVHPIPKLPTNGYAFHQVNIDGSVTTFPGSRYPSVISKLPAVLTEIVPPRLSYATPVFVRPGVPSFNPAFVSLPASPVVVPAPKAPELGPVHVHGIPDKYSHGIHVVPAPIAVLKPVLPELSQSIPTIIEGPKAPQFGPVHVHEIQKIPAATRPTTIYGIPITSPIKDSKPFVSALPRISVPSFRPVPDVKAEETIGPDYVFIPPGTDYKVPVVSSYVYKQVIRGNPNANVTHVNINGQSSTDSSDRIRNVLEKGNKEKQAVAASGAFKYTQIISNPPPSQESNSTEKSPTTEKITSSEKGSLSQNPIVVSEEKGQYSYKQTYHDGSALKVLGYGQNEVTVDIDGKDKEESHRGDIP